MPLILAIEPDRRQAAHLTGLIRHRVGAQLVLADTTERALDAIGNRVPDLVLVPALLSPQDDAALAAALRVIATAAHVRTLTTPVLASTVKPTSQGGVLAKWRRSRAKSSAPDGCDPAVFAEQMTAYLNEAAAERAALEAAWNLPPDVEEPAHDAVQPAPTEPIEVEPPIGTLAVDVEPAIETPAVEVEQTIGPPEDAAALVVVAPVLSEQPSVVMPVHEEVAPAPDTATQVSASSGGVIDLSNLSQPPVNFSDQSALKQLFDAGPGEADAMASAPQEPAIEVFDLLPAVLEGHVEPELLAPKPEETPVVAQPEARPAERPPDRPEWVELIESLRLDVERLRAERLQPLPPGVEQGDTVVRKPKRRTKKPRPIQDEWGFFDPEQCGFAALLAKLDEITDAGDEPEARPPA